jgi:hypothetical protein
MNVTTPVPYDEGIVYAFRALFEGKATEDQQKRAIEWLLLNCCHIGQSSFAPTDRETAFLEGERNVGLQVARMKDAAALEKVKKRQ